MKRILSVLGLALGLLVILVMVAVAYQRLTYYSQHNALLAEIQKHPGLKVVDHWRHEDLALEDFGFAIQSARVTASLSISDDDNIQSPHDRATGIAFKLPREFHQNGEVLHVMRRFIAFDSAEWRQRGLPKVETIADVLAHFDAIAHSLVTNPPLTTSSEGAPDFINMAPAPDRQRSLTPAKAETKLRW